MIDSVSDTLPASARLRTAEPLVAPRQKRVLSAKERSAAHTALCGIDCARTSPETLSALCRDPRGTEHPAPFLAFEPDNLRALRQIVALCATHGLGIVPQTGNSGLVEGQAPSADTVLISMRRFAAIEAFSLSDNTLRVQAGVTLRKLRETCAHKKRLFPLCISSQDQAGIGGLIATNAGGINVLRHGSMRKLTLGIEALLPDGRLFSSLRGLIKDNAGYDLSQLFIGSEGTFGIITRAVLRCFTQPRSSLSAVAGLSDISQALNLFEALRARCGPFLASAEIIAHDAAMLAVKNVPACRYPLRSPSSWLLLLSLESPLDADGLSGFFLPLAQELYSDLRLADFVIAAGARQSASLWKLRHSLSAAMRGEGPCMKFDISFPIGHIAPFLKDAQTLLDAQRCRLRPIVFGHIGDGNLHYDILLPAGWTGRKALEKAFYDLVAAHEGSFAAEHGIGQKKKHLLTTYGRADNVALMRRIKASIDPDNIMNPGRVLL